MKKVQDNILQEEMIVYQAANGGIALRGDFSHETVWGTQKQIADVFGIDRTVVSRHIRNIFNDNELDRKVVCAKIAHTTQHGAIKGKTQTKETDFYNLDIILAVGYRTNSAKAIEFRRWASSILREHITKGYTINRERIGQNYTDFMKAVARVQVLLPSGETLGNKDVLELVRLFADTWFSLDAYDKELLEPKKVSKKKVQLTAEELSESLILLKSELIAKKEATDNFAQMRRGQNLEGIVGNVMQSFGGQAVYPTVQEKAAHLLYFIVKNHPFVDGNKRSGAYAFVWFLHKVRVLDTSRLTPTALTALTLLVAESSPSDKEKVVGLVAMLISH